MIAKAIRSARLDECYLDEIFLDEYNFLLVGELEITRKMSLRANL